MEVRRGKKVEGGVWNRGKKERNPDARRRDRQASAERRGRGKGEKRTVSFSILLPGFSVQDLLPFVQLGWVCGFQLVEKHTEDAGYLNLDKIKDLWFLKGSTIHVGFIQLSEGLSKPDSLLWSICNQWNTYWAFRSTGGTFKDFAQGLLSVWSFTEHNVLNRI